MDPFNKHYYGDRCAFLQEKKGAKFASREGAHAAGAEESDITLLGGDMQFGFDDNGSLKNCDVASVPCLDSSNGDLSERQTVRLEMTKDAELPTHKLKDVDMTGAPSGLLGRPSCD